MKDIIKSNYKDILLVIGYIFVAEMVYIVLANYLWAKWYINLIVFLVIAASGIAIGIIYIKSIIKERNNKQNKE